MPTLINLSGIIVDNWVRYDRFGSLGVAGHVLVSVEDLRRYPQFFERSLFQLGVELESDDEVADIATWLPRLKLIRLKFDVFADGRPFSQAKLLRERFAYSGDICAHGEVLPDQLSFMQRCGINQFSLAAGEDIDLALRAIQDIQDSYQPVLMSSDLECVVSG
jgi:uncharacterized protein (DUF934 family)